MFSKARFELTHWGPTFIGACGLIGIGIACWRQATTRSRDTPLAPERSVELSEPESSDVMSLVPSISTLTFYEGSVSAAEEHLRNRVAALVACNPWLHSRLVRNRGTRRVHLCFEEQVAEKKHHCGVSVRRVS